jgi:hypothetical protein
MLDFIEKHVLLLQQFTLFALQIALTGNILSAEQGILVRIFIATTQAFNSNTRFPLRAKS